MKSEVIALVALWGATLYGPPAAAEQMAPTHVACVGDSITFGYGASSQTMTSYPADLQKLFGAAVHVQNFGHNGATLLSNASLPYIKQPDYAAATTFVANAGATAVVDVVIMLGTNDAYPGNWMNGAKATQFQTDYAALIDHFSSLSTHPTVYVALPPPAYPNNAFNISGTIMQDSIVPLSKQVAAQKGSPVIDVNTAMTGMASLFGDGLHPNDMGYTLLAKTVHDGLLQPLPVDGGTGDAVVRDGGAGDSDGAPADVTTASPDANTHEVGAPDAVASSDSGAMPPNSGASDAGGSEVGGGGTTGSTPTVQSSGCSLAMESAGGSSVPPVVCVAFALLILVRRRRTRAR